MTQKTFGHLQNEHKHPPHVSSLPTSWTEGNAFAPGTEGQKFNSYAGQIG